MVRLYIGLGDRDWGVLVYYGVKKRDLIEVADSLRGLDCPEKEIQKSCEILASTPNSALTYSNEKYRMSIIVLGKTTSMDQFANSFVHEIKHVQSHICEYYGVEEDSEEAAYLIGHLAQRMFKLFSRYKYKKL